MLVYNYHPETGEFLSRAAAHPNPLEPGNWLLPAFATFDVPPAAIPGYTWVWQDGEWMHVADHRGSVYWLGAVQVVIEALGPVPADLSVDPPPSLWRRLVVSGRAFLVGAALLLIMNRVRPQSV
jgi:hypothetical protein